jgi:tetratricopeptide (TPR) repeat protein
MAIRRSKNKQQDEDTLIDVVEVRDNAQDFFEKNKMAILGGLTLLVLLIVAFLAYKYAYKMPREKEASEELVYAERQFGKDSFDLALENPGGGFNGFLGIIDSYSGTKAANLSKYYAGVSYLNLGRYEEAIKYLKDFSPAGEITPIMKNGIIGDAYGELQDYDNALSAYKKAVNSENSYLTPYYSNKLAMLLVKQGNNAEAKKYFQKIKDTYPESNEAGMVDYYLESL